jgi:hemerythrin
MEKMDVNIIELLEYLQDLVENSPKVPMSSKVMIDKKEIIEVIDQIINYMPDQFKKAEWVMNERERILNEAKKEYDSVRKETMTMMRQNIENHDIVKEAKLRAEEIIASAQRDAKAIRLGSRDYSDEILTQLDSELEEQKVKLIKSLQESFELVAKEIDANLTDTGSVIKENIKELRSMNK